MEAVAADSNYIRLCGRLSDKFGDNGIVSVVIGKKEGGVLHIDLWLMSCRVLKRGMEYAMLDRLVEECKKQGISEIMGYYIPTKKNGMVAHLYEEFGFTGVVCNSVGNSVWKLDAEGYSPKNKAIKVKGE